MFEDYEILLLAIMELFVNNKIKVWVCCFIIAMLTIVFFYPLLMGDTFSTVAGYQSIVYPWKAWPAGKSFVPQSDQAELSFPWQSFISNSLKQGDFPLWNPFNFFGESFFSNGSSGLLYPPRLLASLFGFSPSYIHDLLSVIVVFSSGIFMFMFMRVLRCRIYGSLFSAIAWMFGSFNIAWLHLEVSSPLSLFLPLDCWCVLRAYKTNKWYDYCLALLFLSLTLMSGHLPFLGIVFGVSVLYGMSLELFSAWRARGKKSEFKKFIMKSCCYLIFPLLIAAVLLVPSLYTISSSVRGGYTYEQVRGSFSVSPEAFLHLFWPFTGYISEKAMHEMAFVGVFTPIIALFGLVRRKPGRIFFAIIGIITPFFMIDTPFLRLVFAVFPWIGIIHNAGRLFFLWNFAIAGLAGLGLGFCISFIKDRLMLNRLSVSPACLKSILLILIMFGLSFQLLVYGHKINPSFHVRDDALLFPDTPLIQFLQKIDKNSRVMPLSPTSENGGWMHPIFNGSTSLVWSIPSAGGYDSVIPGRTYRLLEIIRGRSVEEILNTPRGETIMAGFNPRATRFDLLPVLGINYIVAAPELRDKSLWKDNAEFLKHLNQVYDGPDGIVWQVPWVKYGPRIVCRAMMVESPESSLKAVVNGQHDPKEFVVLEKTDTREAQNNDNCIEDSKKVDVVHRSNNKLVIEATVKSQSYLVVPESWDSGWTAVVNGQPQAVLHADYAFRAVKIPAGNSSIIMEYFPNGLKVGFVITLVSGFLAIILFKHYLCLNKV